MTDGERRAKDSERAKAWRLANPERNAENRRKWRAANPEKRAAANKRYAEAHPEKIKEKWQRHWANQREKALARAQRYREANRELVRARTDAWRATPEGKEVRVRNQQARRARVVGSIARATAKQVSGLLNDATACYYCDVAFSSDVRPTLEHRLPLKRGGDHSLENLTAACLPCNLRKGAKTESEFRAMKDFT